MIQGFAFQVNNFEKLTGNIKQKSSTASDSRAFNDILDSRNKLYNPLDNKNRQDTSLKENDFLSRKNSVLARKIDIKYEESSKKQSFKDSRHDSIDNTVTKKEKSVKEIVESLQGVTSILQNAVDVSDIDLNNVDLENMDLEVSVEELKSLKSSLENLAEQTDEICNMIENLENMILNAKANGEGTDISDEVEKTIQLKETVEEIIDALKSLNDKINGVGEASVDTSDDSKNISYKLENLLNSLKAQARVDETSETTELKQALTEVIEVIENLNNKINKNQDKDIKSIEEHIKAMDSDLSETSIKIKLATDKIEEIEVLDDALPNVEKLPTDFVVPIENQMKSTSDMAINVEKSSEIINHRQFIDIDKNDIIKQITNKVKSDYESQLNEIKISLTPEHLGELMIKISLERGVLSARALVENTNIKQLLEDNLNDLKENLKEQGLKFDSIDVSVGKDSEFEEKTPDFFMNQKMNQKNNRRLKSTIDNPVSENYYDELNEKSISQSLGVGEGSMNITV